MKKLIGIFIVMLLIVTVALPTISACTGFTASDDDTVLVGCNQDIRKVAYYIRFIPSDGEKYGCMFIESSYPLEVDPEWYTPACGMNDQGLFFDIFDHPYLKPTNSSDKPGYYDPEDYYKYSLHGYCLANCATVEEVVEVFDQYNLGHMATTQMLWVDRSGDSLIIEGDDIIYKEGDFQVVTNFLHSHPELGSLGNSLERYATAVSMLVNMTEMSFEYFRDICNATHQEDDYPTLYSTICDLNDCKMHLYYNYDYDNLLEINLNEELAKGEHVVFLPSLFEPEDNNAPIKPDIPYGPNSGNINEEQTYKVTTTTDPDDNRLWYCFDWGDDTDSGWIPYEPPFTYVSATHSWTIRGDYEVKVKAMDIYGRESEWSDPLTVSMPKSINIFNLFLFRLIQRFPILELLL